MDWKAGERHVDYCVSIASIIWFLGDMMKKKSVQNAAGYFYDFCLNASDRENRYSLNQK